MFNIDRAPKPTDLEVLLSAKHSTLTGGEFMTKNVTDFCTGYSPEEAESYAFEHVPAWVELSSLETTAHTFEEFDEFGISTGVFYSYISW